MKKAPQVPSAPDRAPIRPRDARLPVSLRTRVHPFVTRYGPRALVLAGLFKALSVAAIAPFVGVPLAPTLVVAALWAAGPVLVAQWWRRRAGTPAAARVPGGPGALVHTR